MRSGAKLRHDVSPERRGSKKTSFERKVLNCYLFSLIRVLLREMLKTFPIMIIIPQVYSQIIKIMNEASDP